MVNRNPVIVGTGLSDYPKAPHLDALGHHILATQRALADCGLTKRDIDGFFCAATDFAEPENAGTLVEYLGINPRWFDDTAIGGSAFEFHVQHAMAAIAAGMCETVLIVYGSDLYTKMGNNPNFGGKEPGAKVPGALQFESPWGNTLIGAYAMAAQRHMHEYGTTSEQLAAIAVACRKHAQLNPNAMYRKPLSVADVVNSRMIADPLHLFDCCVVSDGGGALIITTEERARDLKQPPVHILGAANAVTHWNVSQMPDFTTTGAARSGAEAFAMAGLTPDDIDTVQLYDSFTITALLMLEDLGFCKKGEGGPFAASGALELGGRLPMNTEGGALSSCHPGQRGIFLLIEAVRQLRGQGGEAQVKDAEFALACGSGGWLSAIGTVILGKGRP
ncbi:acetyl-CoA acetyltransferase [Dactylosporangium sp. NPDC050688]|uniref:acetyl-CoA acetyltransferase n=1 Tax=Dactylosporangium sp. NPDC050688 TaxID=3157217 RepID=UPI0033F3FFBE